MNTAAKNRIGPTAIMVLSAILAASVFLYSHSQPTDAAPSAATLPVATMPTIPPEKSPAPVRETSRSSHAAILNDSLLEPDPQKRFLAFGRELALWLDEDEAAALAYVRALPQSAQYNEGLRMVLEHISTTDPERAISLAGDMATTTEQRQIYSSLFTQAAQRDVPTAVNLLGLTPPGEARDNALRAIASAWTGQDINAALAWSQSLTDTNERNLAVEISLNSLAATDPQRAFTLATQNLSGDALEHVAATGLKQLVQRDPQTVSELVTQLPPGELQTSLTLDVARALAVQQPETALAWLPSLDSAELRQSALNNVLDLWAAQKPADAALYVSQMPAGADQDAAVTHLSQTLGAANPTDALQWAESLSSESARNAAVVNLASGWAQQDPAAATLWAQSLASENPVRLAALRGAYSYWELMDAPAAANFASALPQADQSQLLAK